MPRNGSSSRRMMLVDTLSVSTPMTFVRMF